MATDSVRPLADHRNRHLPGLPDDCFEVVTPPKTALDAYVSIRADHPDAVLVFRIGDFGEAFHQDARLISKLFGLPLTTRHHGDEATPMSGFPWHFHSEYIRSLVAAGYRVAVLEQIGEVDR